MKIKPTNWQTQVKIFDHENAKRAVVIPKYDEIPVTVIRNNMKTVGMAREEYFSILRSI
jgi:hypothetical protein